MVRRVAQGRNDRRKASPICPSNPQLHRRDAPSGDLAGICAAAPVAFHYTQTDSFVALLAELGASLLVSTYQANKLLVARAEGAACRCWCARSTGRWAWRWMPGGS